jgi:hypothetical protein
MHRFSVSKVGVGLKALIASIKFRPLCGCIRFIQVRESFPLGGTLPRYAVTTTCGSFKWSPKSLAES